MPAVAEPDPAQFERRRVGWPRVDCSRVEGRRGGDAAPGVAVGRGRGRHRRQTRARARPSARSSAEPASCAGVPAAVTVPASRTVQCVASPASRSAAWLSRTTPVPAPQRLRTRASICAAPAASSDASGSSRTRMSGSAMTAQPTASLRSSPPESVAGSRSSSPDRPVRAAVRSTARSMLIPWRRAVFQAEGQLLRHGGPDRGEHRGRVLRDVGHAAGPFGGVDPGVVGRAVELQPGAVELQAAAELPRVAGPEPAGQQFARAWIFRSRSRPGRRSGSPA